MGAPSAMDWAEMLNPQDVKNLFGGNLSLPTIRSMWSEMGGKRFGKKYLISKAVLFRYIMGGDYAEVAGGCEQVGGPSQEGAGEAPGAVPAEEGSPRMGRRATALRLVKADQFGIYG